MRQRIQFCDWIGIEWADILFTKTPDDKKRDGTLATGAWEDLVFSRTVIIGEGEVTVYRAGSLESAPNRGLEYRKGERFVPELT